MRQIARKVFLEHKYPAVQLGAVAADGILLLVDSPIRSEDVRDWLSQLAQHGNPRYLAVLDQHPDRVLGGRSLDLTTISQDITRAALSEWPDTFKGAAQPIGSEADRLKRITGVSRAVPELIFTQEMLIHLGGREVLFWHRPGPTHGSMWVVVPDAEVLFIGDTVTVSEPPYIGEADIEAWLNALDELRTAALDKYLQVASRDGLVDRDAVSQMARFLRKIPVRLSRMEAARVPMEAAASIARELLADFNVPSSRREMVKLRLEAGLKRQFRRLHPSEE